MALIYVLIIILGIFIAGWLLHLITNSLSQTIADLKRDQAAMEKRLKELEDGAKKSRNPYLTNAGLEDTNAVLMNISETLDYLQVRTDHAQKIIGQIRSNPGGYNEDGQNGKREIGVIK